MLELYGIRSIPSLPTLWPEVGVPDRVLFMGRIELFDIQTQLKQMTSAKLIYWIFSLLFEFYGILAVVGYLTPNPFLYK